MHFRIPEKPNNANAKMFLMHVRVCEIKCKIHPGAISENISSGNFTAKIDAGKSESLGKFFAQMQIPLGHIV